MDASRVLAVASILAAPLASAFAAGLPFLHVVPLTLRDGVEVDFARPLCVSVAPQARDALEDSAARGADAGEPVDLHRYQPLDGEPPDAYLRPTFAIDFDEPSVEALRHEAAARYGAQPSIQELVRFTRDALEESWGGGSFAVASRAAATRSGDCSEHAVLLAGLARAFDRPARVVIGVLIVTQGDQLAAFGHAWVEIHDGAHWRRADAIDWESADTLGYVPAGLLGDEGPGYALSMIRSMQSPWFRGVEVVGNAETDTQ